MKRTLFALLALVIAVGAFAQLYPPGACTLTSSGITCTSGSTLTISSGATLVMNGTETGGSYSLVNVAGGSANPWDYTGTLGIMNGSDTFQVFDINITNADHTGAANVVEVLNVGNITGDAHATESAINIGTGWDYGLLTGSLISGSLGLDITGAAVNLNASSNFAVNIGTGTSTGTVTIGGAANQTVAIGNGAAVKTVTLGSTTTTSATTVQSGTGDVTITSTDDGSFTVTDDLTLNGGSAGSIITIGGNTQGNVVNVAADDTTADTITIGSAKDTSTLAGISVTVGSTGTTSATTIQSGSGGITVTGVPTFASRPLTTSAVGTAGTGVANSTALAGVQVSTFTFTLTGANDIDVEDGGKSKGTLIYTFPEGRIIILGATINASIVTNNVYNASTNDIYYVSVGSVDGTQAADADLTSTEADIIPKTTLDTVSSTALTLDWHAAMSTLAAANNLFDGTTTPQPLYLNVAVPDASNTGATTHAVTGTMTVVWASLGDY